LFEAPLGDSSALFQLSRRKKKNRMKIDIKLGKSGEELTRYDPLGSKSDGPDYGTK